MASHPTGSVPGTTLAALLGAAIGCSTSGRTSGSPGADAAEPGGDATVVEASAEVGPTESVDATQEVQPTADATGLDGAVAPDDAFVGDERTLDVSDADASGTGDVVSSDGSFEAEGSAVEAGGGLGAVCMTGNDCMSGLLCGFDFAAGCAAIGHCMATSLLCRIGDPGAYCACDGTYVYLSCGSNPLPNGYSPKPLVTANCSVGGPYACDGVVPRCTLDAGAAD